MNNQKLAHKFFYQDTQGMNGKYSGMSLSFQGNTIYSYYTAIGKIINGKNKQKIFLISDNIFSNTTSKHLKYVSFACPYDKVYVPQTYGRHYMEIEQIEKDLISNIEYSSELNFKLKNDREHFFNNFRLLVNFSEKVKTIKKPIINKYRKIYDKLYAEIEQKEQLKNQRKRENELKFKNYED